MAHRLADLLADHGADGEAGPRDGGGVPLRADLERLPVPPRLLRNEAKYTLPVGLTTFFGENATNYSAVFAGLVITTIPLILLFLLATKQIVAGLTAGMTK